MQATNSFVAMFDFLGFKNLRDSRGTEGLFKLYKSSLLPLIQYSTAMKSKTITKNGKQFSVPDFGPQSIEYRIISDSIILFAEGDTFDHFFKIVGVCHNLLCSGFGCNTPIRGAIGHGDIILDPNSIWIGSAIEDAYLGESQQVWSGCSFTSKCQEFIAEKNYIEEYQKLLTDYARREQNQALKTKYLNARRRIVKYNIPVQKNPKTGPIQYSYRDGYALDWTTNVYEGASEKSFSKTTNQHSNKIIENTLKFETWTRINNRLSAEPGAPH